jgi:hypothetical protein
VGEQSYLTYICNLPVYSTVEVKRLDVRTFRFPPTLISSFIYCPLFFFHSILYSYFILLPFSHYPFQISSYSALLSSILTVPVCHLFLLYPSVSCSYTTRLSSVPILPFFQLFLFYPSVICSKATLLSSVPTLPFCCFLPSTIRICQLRIQYST